MEYGIALKRQRLASGRSLVEVANETGISYQNLSRWERNEVLPNIDFCVKLAKYYGVTIEDLFGIKDI